MSIRNRLLRLYLIAIIFPVSILCYSQQSKTVSEKKDLIIITKMDTLSVIYQNTLIRIRSFSQLDTFVRSNLMQYAKPRVEIRGTRVIHMKILTESSRS